MNIWRETEEQQECQGAKKRKSRVESVDGDKVKAVTRKKKTWWSIKPSLRYWPLRKERGKDEDLGGFIRNKPEVRERKREGVGLVGING